MLNNSRKLRFFLLIFVIFFLAALLPAAQTARGVVFDDSNRNGQLDPGEKGIAGVAVSNQIQVVRTGSDGSYRLPVKNDAIIFISKPAGYDVPLDENNLPGFYYIHSKKGTPKTLKLKYPGLEATGKLPKRINFPLHKSEPKDEFSVIFMGDPQTRTFEQLNYYRDDVVSKLIGTDAAFYLDLGDIMYDNLEFYPGMNRVLGQMGIPVYHTMGNHDMNFHVPCSRYEAETFKRYFGPDYYSFNYGKVHFIVLNTVKYLGWNKEENKKGLYIGHLHKNQLSWIKNDLALVPKDRLVVLAMHIPFDSGLDHQDSTVVTNRTDLYSLLEDREHLLAVAGHMHFFEFMELSSQQGWHGKTPLTQITAGAGCGCWWHGPKDPAGLPYGMCTDGMPNGYFKFQFKGNGFRYRFFPANPGAHAHSQMRINFPDGNLSRDQLRHRYINVNVFTGTPKTVVTCRLDKGPEIEMTRQVMEDPFFDKLVKDNPEEYIWWMQAVCSSHIWIAPLPDDLEPGLHRLKVTAKDHQGEVFTAYRLFNIK